MSSYNKVILMGNLTRDPESRATPSGAQVCKFGLAVNEKYKDRESTVFVDVTAFGHTGNAIAKYCAKGDSILIDGRLNLDQWDDKRTGQKRSKLSVIANSFEFAGSGREDSQQPDRMPEDYRGQHSERPQSPSQPSLSGMEQPKQGYGDDDDLPF